MGDVPETIASALSEVPVDGQTCLEAGAGAGNATAALRARGADDVYAVTDDRDHGRTVRERFSDDDAASTLLGDLRDAPLPDDAVDVVTAHALFNVVPTPDVTAIVEELTRVAAPGAWLVVDDYDPVPDDGVRDLFAVENAVSEIVAARPALTFYPREHLRALFAVAGWHHERTRTLLDPVPWTSDLLDAHADLAAERAETLPDPLEEALEERVRTVRERAGDSVDTGNMYSLVFRLPE